MIYVEIPYYPTLSLTIDTDLEDNSNVCHEPIILSGMVEGSMYVLVGAEDMADGIMVQLSTGDFGYLQGGLSLIKLKEPLKANQSVSASINTPTCKVSGCGKPAEELVSGVDACKPFDRYTPAGILTGAFLCDGKDFYREVHNGEGGVMKGELVIDDCIWCGGINPNCEEE